MAKNQLGENYSKRVYNILNTDTLTITPVTNMKRAFEVLEGMKGSIYAYEDTLNSIHDSTPQTRLDSYNMFKSRLRKYGTLKVSILNPTYYTHTDYIISDHFLY